VSDRNPDEAAGEDPRVRLAGERTLLSWIRTGLAMMGFGFVVARFGLFLREMAALGHPVSKSSGGLSLWIGTAAVLLGVAINVLATAEHLRFLRALNRGRAYQPQKWSLAVVLAIIVAVLGLGTAGYLVVVEQ
jgi:putative membrane protein